MADRIVEEEPRVVEHHYHNVDHEHDHGYNNFNGLIALVILVVIVILIFVYGLPALRSISSGPSISVPKSVDININRPSTTSPTK